MTPERTVVSPYSTDASSHASRAHWISSGENTGRPVLPARWRSSVRLTSASSEEMWMPK